VTAPRLLTLLSDFGLAEGYVGAMKGAILTREPALALVDLTHAIAPGDIDAASVALAQAAPHFPAGTVHLAVVDPGVGSERQALACRIGSHFYVAPDNGLLSGVLELAPVEAARAIADPRFAPRDASPVFHGRDIFGPAAAHLAVGGPLEALGPALDPQKLVRRSLPAPERAGDAWIARVRHVDRFGNLITNLALPAETSAGSARVGPHRIAFARTYSAVVPGALLALRGSSGQLEIARNGASAAEELRIGRGAVVEWRAS
jgi:S-adenosyl-L-methionine hydrolase (adenosine-forming)